MAESLVLEYGNMLGPRLGGRGIEPEQLESLSGRFAEIQADVDRRRTAGELGFLELTGQRELVEQIRTYADGAAGPIENVIVLGIGGSALGTLALKQALLHPFWNELDDEGRDYYPRLYVLDNVDPTTIGPLLDRLDPGRTLFDVVSKSGSTAETMAQFLIVRDRLERAIGSEAARAHLVFTTDPEQGILRRIAEDEGITAFPVPSAVGGRFSVLSAVGLLPAALVGIDVDALLAGAEQMSESCRTDRLLDNPAGLFAALQFLAHERHGAAIHVMMAYSDRLYGCADWFRQLWAESLGKRVDTAGREVFRGPTPVKALGATDQHSQVQLYVEGPYDKTVTFLTTRESDQDVVIPEAYTDLDSLAYLGGHTLGELLRAEHAATAHALAHHGRMNMSIELPAVTAHTVGQLLMLLQIATVYAGALYDVDPLDQPGVELGKRLTYGLMGRQGFEPPAIEADSGRRWPRG